MTLRPNLDGWLPVICWGIALHVGLRLGALAEWVVVTVAGELVK